MSGSTRLRLATWNVNSLTARLPRVEEWIGYAQPDVAVPAGDEAVGRHLPDCHLRRSRL